MVVAAPTAEEVSSLMALSKEQLFNLAKSKATDVISKKATKRELVAMIGEKK